MIGNIAHNGPDPPVNQLSIVRLYVQLAQSFGSPPSFEFCFPAPSPSSALSLRFCTTSQLYTRAIATSIVCIHRLVVVILDGDTRCPLTVICSRRKSKSSSQFERLVLAVESFVSSRVSASSMGYDSITFALRNVSRVSLPT